MIVYKICAVMLSMALLVPDIAFAKAGSDKEAEEYARYAWDDSGSMNMSVDYIEGAKLEAEYEKTKLLQMRSGGAATYVRVNLSEELFPNNGEAKSEEAAEKKAPPSMKKNKKRKGNGGGKR